jgi:actin-like ATPase involved in cell morphogenesis
MAENPTEKTTASEQHGPYAEPGVTGISKIVRSELGKLHPELARKIEDHVSRKG